METQTQGQIKMREVKKTGSLLIAGCTFIGMTIGWYSGYFKIALFSGMGIGFIMMAVTIASAENKK